MKNKNPSLPICCRNPLAGEAPALNHVGNRSIARERAPTKDTANIAIEGDI